MKRWTPLLLMLAAAALSLSCSHRSDEASTKDKNGKPQYEFGVIDTVKFRKDPKGGWFGPSLRDVYMAREDTPIVFCESGPSFPTGQPVTIFYHEILSKPDSSRCKAAVAVVEGRGFWIDGKPVTSAELAQMREHEEHFHHQMFGPSSQMTFAWRKPKPIGDPCPDTSGSPDDVIHRYKGQNCSIAVVYDSTTPLGPAKYTLFVNWKVVGIDDTVGVEEAGPAPSDLDTIQIIIAKYGSKYVVFSSLFSNPGPGGGGQQQAAGSQPVDPAAARAAEVREKMQMALSRRKEAEEAVTSFTLAIKANPTPFDYQNRCEAFITLKRFSEAVSDCTRGIEGMHEFPNAESVREMLELRSQAYLGLGESEKAAQDSKRVETGLWEPK